MISSVTYDESTHTVHIVWNTDAGGKTTDISLSGLIDTYTAGYGLILDHGEFSVDTTEVAQLSNISGFSKVSLISNDVEYSKDLSVIKLSADEYYTLVADGNVNQSALYVIDDDTNNAFGKKIVNVAPPELSDDAATKAYVDA